MNQLAHIFITYFILSFIVPETQKYLLPIALFSVILDLDHLPGYVRMLTLSKKEKAKLQLADYVNWFRTAIQEPIGILTIEVVLFSLHFLGLQSIYLMIAGLGIFIHWVIDFLTVHTRPFDPINKRIISLFFNSKKQRLISEIIITVVSGILFFIVYLS